MKHGKLSSMRLKVLSLAIFCLLGFCAAQAQDRHVTVINETSVTMTHFYASNVYRGSWEEDILGLGVLGPDRYVVVNVDDGTRACYFDFKAVFLDGREVIRRNVNVCEITSWTIY